METGVVTIQEPVSTKTSIEEPAGVLLDKSSMEVDKVNHSTVLDDEITSRDTEKDEQGSIFVHEPESSSPKIVLSDVSLEKKKEDDITRKQEEVIDEKPVIEEDQSETKHTPEQEEQIDTGHIKVDEDNIEESLNSAREAIPIKNDEVKEEKDSRTADTSVNGTKSHDPKSLKENVEPVEVTVDKEQEEDLTRNTQEVHGSLTVIDTPIIQEEEIDSKASKDIEEHEHVFVRDIPQNEAVEALKVQESEILKNLETKTVETDAKPSLKTVSVVEDSKVDKEKASETEKDEQGFILSNETLQMEKQEEESVEKPVTETETKHTPEQGEEIYTGPVKVDEENVEKSLNSAREEIPTKTDEVKVEKDSITIEAAPEDETATNGELVHDVETTKGVILEAEPKLDTKEKDETEIVKTVVEDPKIINHEETTASGSKSLKENSEPVGPEQISSEVTVDKEKEEVQEITPVIDTPKIQGEDTEEYEMVRDIPQRETLATKTDETDAEPSLNLKEDNKPSDPVQETITIVEPPTIQKEEMESIISPQLKEETYQSSKDTEEDEHVLERNMPEGEIIGTLPENLKTKEDTKPLHQNEQEKETKLHKEEIEKQEPTNEGVTNAQEALVEGKPDEVIQVSSVSASEKQEHVPVAEAEKIEDEKVKEAEPTGDTEEHEHVSVRDIPQVESLATESETSTVQESAILKTLDTKQDTETIKDLKEDKEQEETDVVKTPITSDEVQETPKVLETPTIQGEDTESKASKDIEEHEHVLARDLPQDETLVTEAETVDTSLSSPLEVKHTLEEASELVAESQEEKPKQVEEIEETKEANDTKVDTIPQESTLSDFVPVQIKREDNVTERHESQELFSKAEESKETTVAQGEQQTRDIGDSLAETQLEEQVEGETKTKEEQGFILSDETLQKEKQEEESVEKPVTEDKQTETKHTPEKVEEISTGLVKIDEENVEKSLNSVQEITPVIDTPTIQGEDTEEHDIPQRDTLATKYETVETSTDQEYEILKNLETKTDETDAEPSLNLKEDNKPSDPVQETITIVDPPTIQKEEMESIISPQLKEEDEHVLERNMPEGEIIGTLPDNLKIKEDTKPSLPDVESSEQIKKPSLESHDEVSEETSKTVDEKIEEKQEEEVALQEKEPKLHKEEIEKQEPTNEGVTNAQEALVEEMPDEVVQVSSVSASEERESETVVGVEHETVAEAEKIEDEKVKEAEPTCDTEEHEHVSVRDIPQVENLATESEAVETSTVQESAFLKTLETKDDTEPIMNLKEDKEQEETDITSDEVRSSNVQAEDFVEVNPTETLQDESSEKHENLLDEPETSKTLDMKIEEQPEEVTQHQEGKEETQVADTIQKSLETVDTGPVKFKEDDIEETLNSTDEVNKEKDSRPDETSVNGTEAEHDAAVPVEEISRNIVNETTPEKAEPATISHEMQETPKVLETPTIQGEETELKASKDTEEHEHVLVKDLPQVETLVTETETVDTSPVQEAAILKTLETETDETEAVHNPIDGEVKDQDTKEDVEPSLDLKENKEQEETKSDISFDIKDESQGREDSVDVKPTEIVQDESNQEKDVSSGESVEEMKKPSVESPTEVSKETSKAVDEKIEEKSDEVVQVSSASASEEREEQVEDKIQRSLETVEIVEPHSSVSSPLEEHQTLGESSELVAESEEEKPKQVKETTKEIKEVNETKVDTLPEETLSDVLPVQIKREGDATESHESQVELSKAEETKETTVVQEEQTRDIGASLTEDLSTEEQVEGDTKTKEPEDEFVDSSERFDNEPLTAEKKKEDEAITVGSDVCIKEEEFENLEAPTKLEEPKEDKSPEVSETIKATDDGTLEEKQTPSFVSELEDQIPKQIEEIHEEETKESHTVEAATSDQTSSLVSEDGEQIPKKVEEIQEEETKEAHKLQSEEILPTEITPRESSDEALVSTLVSKEDDKVTPQEGTSTTSENVFIKQEEIRDPEATKLEESKDISETIEPIEAKDGQTQPIETSEASETTSFISELEDKIPKQVEEIHEEATKEALKEEATSDQSLLVEASHEDKTTKQVEEINEEEEEEPKVTSKVEATSDQTPSSELEDQTPKQIEEIHEEVTKAQESQDEEILPPEIVPRESFSEAPVSVLASEKQHVSASEVIEEQDSLNNETADDFTFSKETREEDHGDENSSTLPVVGILTQLQTTFENERAINESASSEEKTTIEPAEQVQKTTDAEPESSKNDLHSIKEEPETLEKHLVTDISDEAPAPEIIEANKLQPDGSEETGLAGKSLPVEELNQEEQKGELKVPEEEIVEPEHVTSVEKQEEHNEVQDLNASTAETITLQEEHPREFEFPKTVEDDTDQVIESELPAISSQTEQKEETHETVKEEDQTVAIKEENKTEDKEDASELDVSKEEAPHSDLGNEEEKNKVATSEKNIPELPSEAEKESTQTILEDTPKDQREEVSVDKSLTKEALDEKLQSPNPLLEEKVEETSFEVKKAQEDIIEESANDLITNENVQVQGQPKNFEFPVTDKETSEQEQKSNDLTDVQEDNGTNVKQLDVHDTVETPKEETDLKEEKREVKFVKIEPEAAVKHEVSVQEKNNAPEEIDLEATKESKQTDTTTAIKEEIKEEQKETTLATREIENLSSVSKTQDKSKQKDEVPTPKLENVKTAEELQQKDKESENIFPQVKEETEETVQEPARKSLSSLIEKVEGTNKNEDTTKEEAKIEEEDENDKKSPDSIVMVEAKDTIIKAQHKKSPGILSGVGSKVKHSISKVKKVFTGNKSSHTTS